MTNAHFTRLDQYRDIESLRYVEAARALGHVTDDELLAGLAAMSRDNARTPVQWDGSAHAGFTTGTPWLPVNVNHQSINARAERADPRSVFHYYRRLIALRHDDPVVALGDFTMLLAHDESVYAFTRGLDGVELLVLGNFTGEERTVSLEGWGPDARGDPVLGNYADVPVGEIVLRPWETRVYRQVRTAVT